MIGTAVRRIEDPDLVRGLGTYVHDLPIGGLLHLAFVRSPVTHGVLSDVDPTSARQAPGVVAVYTAADLGTNLAGWAREADGFDPLDGRAVVVVRARMEYQRVAITPLEGNAINVQGPTSPPSTPWRSARRALGRPVSRLESRSENLVVMPHGRTQVHYVELGCRLDGRIVGLRVRVVGDAGAYAGFGGGLAIGPTRTRRWAFTPAGR